MWDIKQKTMSKLGHRQQLGGYQRGRGGGRLKRVERSNTR